MKAELTKQLIDRAVCKDGKQIEYVMDTILPGFGICLTSNGHKSYVVRFQHKGKKISKSIAPVQSLSLAVARTRAKEIIAAYTMGQDPFAAQKTKSNNLTIKALFNAWQEWAKERNIKRNSVSGCYSSLRQYFDLDRKFAESLTVRELTEYQNIRMKQQIKPSTINRNVRELKYLYTWGASQGLISSEYEFPRVKNLSEAEISPKVHHLSQDDIQKLLEASMQTSPRKEHLRWIILFMLNTGTRPASICGLRWSDIIRLDSNGGEIRLRADNIKTRKDVNVSVSSTAAEILQTLAQRPHQPDDNIFTTQTPANVNRDIKRLMKRAGLPPELSAYSLRHNYATSLYLAGASPTEIQIQMCHRDYKTTQKYIHANFEHQKQVANLLSFGNPSDLKSQTA